MGHLLAVAVVALVEAGRPAEVGGRGVGGDGAFPASGDSRGVVGEASQGELAKVEDLGGDVGTREEGGLFKVAVGEVPVGVVEGDDPPLDLRREGHAPQHGPVALGEQDPSHSGLGGVDSLEGRRVLVYHFGYAGWTGAEVLGEALEVVEVVPDVPGDLDPAFG